MILNQGDFQTYWSTGLFLGISHQNSRNRSVLNWNLKTPHGLFTPTHPSPFLAWRVPWGMVGSPNLTPPWRRGGRGGGHSSVRQGLLTMAFTGLCSLLGSWLFLTGLQAIQNTIILISFIYLGDHLGVLNFKVRGRGELVDAKE